MAAAAWPAPVDAATGGARREQGEAFAADGPRRLLYRETHYVLPGPDPERWVLYRCPDGRPFARKHVQAAGRAAAPDFAFEDARDGYREGVRGAPGARTVYVRADGRSEAARGLAVPADGVIDAGFDAAVRGHWTALMRGETVRLRFLVPARKQFFPVKVRRVGGLQWKGAPAERLRMSLDTWFGFAVPDVTLVYARDDRRLLEFNGTGNVRDRRGHNPQVRITFAQPPQPAGAAEVAAVAALPLDGRCGF